MTTDEIVGGVIAGIVLAVLGLLLGAALERWGQSQMGHGTPDDDYEGSLFV